MKTDVFDTWVRNRDGRKLHFDLLLPQGSKQAGARAAAAEWLASIGVDHREVSMERCDFCHSEAATPEVLELIERQGYAVIEMEGCPSQL